MHAIGGSKEQSAVDVRQVGIGIQAAAVAGVNIFDYDGAAGGAVAFPELTAVHAVVGREVSLRVDCSEVEREGTCNPWVDVFQEVRRQGWKQPSFKRLQMEPH